MTPDSDSSLMSSPEADTLRIGGLLPLTTVEWEGRLAAVLFLQGCRWRCHYCHNTALVSSHSHTLKPWSEVLAFLQERQGLLDAIVFSGGEPTIQPALPAGLWAAKELGYLVALHTNGCNPTLLRKILTAGLVDFVAMDVKAPFAEYPGVTQVPNSGQMARVSAMAIIESGVAHEFRTTYHSDLLTPEDIHAIATDLAWRGAKAYYLQRYRDEGCGDLRLTLTPSEPLPESLLRKLSGMFEKFGQRG